MQLIKKIAIGVIAAAAFSTSASASVVQSTTPASYYGYQQWGSYSLGSVTFAEDTNTVTGLTTTAGIADQGWGGEWADANQVYMSLQENGTQLWSQHVAGAYHNYTTQTYDITNDQASLTALNKALAGIQWTNTTQVTMTMYANPIGWGGWALSVDNASFSVTSANVPEPASLALLGLGLTGLLLARRKKAN